MEAVPVTMPTEIRRRRNELVPRVQRADDPAAVFAEASTRLRRLVPFDAAVWLTIDQGTGLPTAPTLADNLELDGELRVGDSPWGAIDLLRRRGRPGLLLFDRHGGLVLANEEARAWLAELPSEQDLPGDLGVGVPMWMLGTVFGALAGAVGAGTGRPAAGSGPAGEPGWCATPP
jgi:hypothetical protein